MIKNEIRVFVSSTFEDMSEERDLLARTVFPRLSMLCRRRGGTLTIVDLRWGITKQQAENNEVLPICLKEIDRCRPFFIGILGERYGWSGFRRSSELIERYDLLGRVGENTSITHLEMLYGALENPDMAENACFFLRCPDYAEGKKGYAETAPQAKEGLNRLKKDINGSGLKTMEYKEPNEFALAVEDWLTGHIDSIFPSGQPKPNIYENEKLEQEIYIQSMIPKKVRRYDGEIEQLGVYLGNDRYFEALDAHAGGCEGVPIVLYGESGCGKSALLANWAAKFREANPDTPMILHFVGGTADSTNLSAMLSRIMYEFKEVFDIEQKTPAALPELITEFAKMLHRANAKGGCIIIIDALDQLEDIEGAQNLSWLPLEIPERIRVILSTVSGKAFDEIKRRNYTKIVDVSPLSGQETAELIAGYLGQKRKTLTDGQLKTLSGSGQCGNPLYLMSLLDELCVCGKYETLGDQITEYLKAEDVSSLFQKIFSRWETDYDTHRQCLTRDTLGYIWASRSGLSEKELLDLLGERGKPLPAAFFATLRAAADRILLSRGGLLDFSHKQIRDAVGARYIKDEGEKTHALLAKYFAEADPEAADNADGQYLDRTLHELPWQLDKAKDYKGLHGILKDINFFYGLSCKNRYEAEGYWYRLEEKGYKMDETYRHVIGNPLRHADILTWFCWELRYFGYQSQAKDLQKFLLDNVGEIEGGGGLLTLLYDYANTLYDTGAIGEARAIFAGIIKYYEDGHRAEDEIYLASLTDLGNTFSHTGDLDSALVLFGEAARKARQKGDLKPLTAALWGQAQAHKQRGDLTLAMDMFREHEEICRRTGSLGGLQSSLCSQGDILYAKGSYMDAAGKYIDAETICRQIGDLNGLQYLYGGLALLYASQRKYPMAMRYYARQQELCGKLNNKRGLQESLGNLGNMFADMGFTDREYLDRALELYDRQEELCRDIDYAAGLRLALENKASVLAEKGDFEKALPIMEEQIEMDRRDKDVEGVIYGLINTTIIYKKQQKLGKALANAQEALSLAAKHCYASEKMKAAALIQSIRDDII